MKTSFISIVLAAIAGASAQGVTAKISPTAPAPAGCSASVSGVFGIQAVNITTTGGSMKKRAVVSQIGDGQIQAATSTTKAAVPITQIGDGQIQAATTTAKAAAPITQIGDGQIQAPTSSAAAGMVTVTVTKDLCVAAPITQISDGQIQAPMATPVTQIADGQIQAPAAATSATPVKQISDGQIQATTGKATTATPVTQIGDGQIQAATTLATSVRTSAMSTSSATAALAKLSGAAQACASAGVLEITLANGVLTDSQGRTGYIAANYQFQFDKPVQTGAIYTAGWSLCSNNSLALGGSAVFYQCLSGSFYNLYNQNIGAQCVPVTIEAVQLNSC